MTFAGVNIAIVSCFLPLRLSRTGSGESAPLRLTLVACAAEIGRRRVIATIGAVEFRRITNLPPYVFTIINNLKIEARARRRGRDRPRLRQPRHPLAGDRRREARRGGAHAAQPPLLALARAPEAARGRRRAVRSAAGASSSTPRLEITNTIGSKEGFSHLMWVLLEPGDAAIVPSPSYPIHIYGPLFAGADLRQVPMRSCRPGVGTTPGLLRAACTTAWDVGWPKPRVLVISFPHNPTGACVDLDVHAAGRRLLPRARDDRRARLRLRRHRLRRLQAALASCRPREPRSAPSSCTR